MNESSQTDRGERGFEVQGKVCVRKQSPGCVWEIATLIHASGKPTTEIGTNRTEKDIQILNGFTCFFFFFNCVDFISRSLTLILSDFYLMSRSIKELYRPTVHE